MADDGIAFLGRISISLGIFLLDLIFIYRIFYKLLFLGIIGHVLGSIFFYDFFSTRFNFYIPVFMDLSTLFEFLTSLWNHFYS